VRWQIEIVTDNSEKPLRTTSFVIHATRGVIRDSKTRRQTMFVLLAIALALLFVGSTILRPALSPHEHPVGFILFWIVCGWFAFTAMLLAVFDLLIVKLKARKAARALRENFKTNSPRSTVDE
jgi:formate-dependent nitrite reductase membrane component NrfD